MKFLVLGTSGMAGHMIGLYLKEKGHEVVGCSRKKVDFVDSCCCDARDTDKITALIEQGNYDAVVNCIGILNQFAEGNNEAAAYLNGYFPHFLAKITEDMDTQIIHISTDCVFSGDNSPYSEESIRDGKSFYARSKAMGELKDNKNLTLRTSIVGPDINENGIGLLNWFMKNNEMSGYANAMWTGITTLELAKIIEKAAEAKTVGLVNMVYEKNISKYELLKLFNRYIRDNKAVIHKDESFVLDKSLIRTNYEFDYKVPDYDSQIIDLAEWIKNHKSLYPQYKI